MSNFTNRVDAKGRVSIPASFRAVLSRDGFDGLHVYPSLETAAVDCGGHALLKEINVLLSPLSKLSETWEIFAAALYSQSENLKLDGEGRIVMSETIRAHAGIGTEVTFVGLGHKFQLWEPSRFRAYLTEARGRVREARKQLGSQSAAEARPASGARE